MAVQQLEIGLAHENEHALLHNHVGVQARLLLGGVALNPHIPLQDTDIMRIADNTNDTFTDRCLSRGSLAERTDFYARDPNQFHARKENWKNSFVNAVNNLKTGLAGTPQEQRFADTYSKLGIDFRNFNNTTAEVIYQAWCTNADADASTGNFVDTLINTYTIEELESNADVIEWIANIFGEKSAKTIPLEAIAKKKKLDDQARTELIQQAIPEANNIDELGNEILTFLWENRPPEDTHEIMEARELQGVRDLYSAVTEPVNPANPNIERYFIENPPDYVRLSPEERRNLQVKEPYFIALEEPNITINNNTAPYILELSQEDENGGDARYRSAQEQIPDKEPGFFELSAAVSPTPETQAKLYSLLSGQVIQSHIEDPELLLQWLATHRPQRFAEPSTKYFQPLLEFAKMDYDENRNLKTDEQSLLLRYTVNRQLDLPSFVETWQARTQELQQAWQNGNLLPHHYKWLEFMSHSIRMPGLLEIIKSQQSLPLHEETPLPQNPQAETDTSGTESGLEAIKQTGWDEFRNQLTETKYSDIVSKEIRTINQLKKQPSEQFHPDEIAVLNGNAHIIAKTLEYKLPQIYPVLNTDNNFYSEIDEQSGRLLVKGRQVTATAYPVKRIYMGLYNHQAPSAFQSLFDSLALEDALSYITVSLDISRYDPAAPHELTGNDALMIYVDSSNNKAMEKVARAIESSKQINRQEWHVKPHDLAAIKEKAIREFKIPLDESTFFVEAANNDRYSDKDPELVWRELYKSRGNHKKSLQKVVQELGNYDSANPGEFTSELLKDASRRKRFMPGLVF